MKRDLCHDFMPKSNKLSPPTVAPALLNLFINQICAVLLEKSANDNKSSAAVHIQSASQPIRFSNDEIKLIIFRSARRAQKRRLLTMDIIHP